MASINIPNKFLSAHYKKPLTANSLKLQFLALHKLYENRNLSAELMVNINAKEWQLHFPGSENPYRDLKRAAKGLIDFCLSIEQPDNMQKLFAEIIYHDGEGRIELFLNPKLV